MDGLRFTTSLDGRWFRLLLALFFLLFLLLHPPSLRNILFNSLQPVAKPGVHRLENRERWIVRLRFAARVCMPVYLSLTLSLTFPALLPNCKLLSVSLPNSSPCRTQENISTLEVDSGRWRQRVKRVER